MSNVETLAVYRDNKNGIPTTEESHAKQEVYAAFIMWKKRAMYERDGTPESWLRMQEALDLWAAEMKFKKNPKIAPRAFAA